MSVATIAPTVTSRTAEDLDAVAQAANGGGDFFATTGVEMLYITNGGVSDITLTVDLQATVDGQAVTNKTYTITHGTHHYLIGPFRQAWYADASGNVAITYSAVTSVNVAVIKPGAA